MSIFSKILGKIFPATRPAAPAQAAPAPSASSIPLSNNPAPTHKVDVYAVLVSLAEKSSEELNWRSSIVDLLKLLDLDSSLTARKALASELHYSGDMNDSATMNVWLHQEVMNKLEENGGVMPTDLKASA